MRLALLVVLAALGSQGFAAQRIQFEASGGRTVFDGGSAAFRVSPAPAIGETVQCGVDHESLIACNAADGGGRVQYVDLTPGRHVLRVRLRAASGRVLATATQALDVVRMQVVVYGATPGGISAALAASRAGKSVLLIEPTRWVGGMMSGGLGVTDIGRAGTGVIGGIASEFLHAVAAYEQSKGACTFDFPCPSPVNFEPSAAEHVFEQLLAAQPNLVVERSALLRGVELSGTKITRLQTTHGTVSGRMFIDASYEGDLMARAGVSYIVGREPKRVANPQTDRKQLAVQEDIGGTGALRYPFGGLKIDPYVVAGHPASGRIALVEAADDPRMPPGSGDHRVMAYTYRLCVTNDPGNRVAFSAPPGYDPKRFEGSARLAEAMRDHGTDPAKFFFRPAATVHSSNVAYFKYDLNGNSAFSTDFTAPELNQAYPEADEADRARIRAEYKRLVQGLLYFWQTSPRFGNVNVKVAQFGLCRDEFVDRGNWPQQLYVRQARRMVGTYVVNENDAERNGRRPGISDSVGLAGYNFDEHIYRYLVKPRAKAASGVSQDLVAFEGQAIRPLPGNQAYPVPYRALTPKASQVTNLLVPVALSATNVAYSSLRLEPTYMILGQSAGIAASLAIDAGTGVQAIDYSTLRQWLLTAGQRL